MAKVKEFECNYCSGIYPTRLAMKAHLIQMHNSQIQPSDMEGLQEKERAKKVHECPVCFGRLFVSQQAMKQHVLKYHQKLLDAQAGVHVAEEQANNPKSCPLCATKVFTTELGLQKHYNAYHSSFILGHDKISRNDAPEAMEVSEKATEDKEPLATCSKCPEKVFKSLQGLKKHKTQAHKEMLTLTEQPEIICQTFEALEVTDAASEKSAPEDAQEKVTCPRCPEKSFKSQQGLKKHTTQAHKDCLTIPEDPVKIDQVDSAIQAIKPEGTKKIACPSCPSKTFNTSKALEKHIKGHKVVQVAKYPEYEQTEAGFVCSVCPNKVFKTKQLIQLHRRKQHKPRVEDADQKRNPCLSCKKSFQKKGQLRMHVARVHVKKVTEQGQYC